jgi:enamine deaminase RidA (YjgF/YER057c/UK114 family)
MRGDIERLPDPARPGVAWFVRVADVPLLFTELIFPSAGSADGAAQVAQVIDSLGGMLAEAGGDLRQIVRLNFYVRDDAVTPMVHAALATRFRDAPPAVTIVRSTLAQSGASVACDAVAAITRSGDGIAKIGSAAVLPAGGKAFISGQAKRGKDLADSVTQTMEALHASLPHIGLSKADVVQVKAFINPLSSHAIARAAIEKSYAGGRVPAVVITEWLSSTPTEIELITAAPRAQPKSGEVIEYHWLPDMPVSPYYSRMTTVAAGSPLVFIGNIDGGDAAPRDQWLHAFERLAGVLRDCGSSFRHMAKATYFLADPSARDALGEIRNVFYDPARPPAASAIDVQSIGVPRRAVALDMIVVPAKRGPAPVAPK